MKKILIGFVGSMMVTAAIAAPPRQSLDAKIHAAHNTLKVANASMALCGRPIENMMLEMMKLHLTEVEQLAVMQNCTDAANDLANQLDQDNARRLAALQR